MIHSSFDLQYADSGRYDRPVDGWNRSSGMSSSSKQFSGIGGSGGGGSSMSSRDAWASSDRKSDAQPPWSRSAASTSDRYCDQRI